MAQKVHGHNEISSHKCQLRPLSPVCALQKEPSLQVSPLTPSNRCPPVNLFLVHNILDGPIFHPLQPHLNPKSVRDLDYQPPCLSFVSPPAISSNAGVTYSVRQQTQLQTPSQSSYATRHTVSAGRSSRLGWRKRFRRSLNIHTKQRYLYDRLQPLQHSYN